MPTRTYLSAKMEIAEKNRCLRARDNQDDENQKEESVHIVYLRGPN